MRFKTSCILICVFSVSCFCKDVIHISIDNDKLELESYEKSREKNIQIEISKAKNQSQENAIPISSFSASLEQYWHEQPDVEGQKPRRALNNIKHKTYLKKENMDTENMHNKETRHKRTKSRKDAAPQVKEQTKLSNNYLFHDKINDNSFENPRKIPTMLARIHAKSQSEEEITSPKVKNLEPHLQRGQKFHKVSRGNAQFEPMDDNVIYPDEEPAHSAQVNRDATEHNGEDDHASSEFHPKRKDLHYCEPSANESADILIVPRSSTIEASNHKYQANTSAEESDEEQDSLANYPYSVSVQKKGAHYASGALVKERWVLSTAAEFIHVRESIKLFRLRMGSVNCKKGGSLTPILTIVVHPSFVPGRPSFDISMLRTAKPMVLTSLIKPIGLSRVSGKVVSAKFLTTYWPRIVVKQGVVPPSAKERIKYNSMRVSTQKLVPTDECSKRLAAANVTLDKNSLCLKPVKVHHSDCMPDVGAPVVAVDGLWGITSGWVSPRCPSVILPTVFTRVTTLALRNWINDLMGL